ncbi:MAG TPA: HD-GYP domain-containing protein [Pseudomonadales bacterium]|nr:HD-GYP domain-containing protein [Pseudomonadales bacterium]
MAADVALSQALAYARDLKAVCEVWQERERELKHVNARLRASHRQSLRYAADLKKTYWRMERTFLNSLLALANALEARDAYTRGHSDRVAASARTLALASGLTSPAAETVAQAGRLHDLGKIGVPESVLGKGGPLTDEEWAIMRLHPLTGAQILAPLEFFGEGMLIVRHHHERFDGSGYPDGLRGPAIPLGARIVAVADVYDALTSDRAYRRRLSHPQAMERLLGEAGRTLDGELVVLFADTYPDGPPDRAV